MKREWWIVEWKDSEEDWGTLTPQAFYDEQEALREKYFLEHLGSSPDVRITRVVPAEDKP